MEEPRFLPLFEGEVGDGKKKRSVCEKKTDLGKLKMHTFVRSVSEGCHKIDISQESNPDVQKREPDGLLPTGE